MHGYWAQFLKVAVAHFLALASPGPDFAMVLKQSLTFGRRIAIWTSIGIGSAILIHLGYCLLGIGLVVRSSPMAFTVLTFAGAGYLAWIGVRALAAKPGGSAVIDPPEAAFRDRAWAGQSRKTAWSMGFFTNALNPKATLFFVALFSTVVDPLTPKLILAGYGLWMGLVATAWFIVVSILFTRQSVRSAFLRAGHWIDRTMGVVFILFAAALLYARFGR